ncbi:unnamed protein product [Lymnaea stagnalis]|uniref:HTH La-type RNA-binding domain-containing protein n=1 Tax=Lymnaea stagnalis TaxID=6523 RepID=A0AAV2HYB8_LYMST
MNMMTQDRATGQPMATPASPRNLNPAAQPFRQSQQSPTSPKNLNPSAPVFHQTQSGDRSPSEVNFVGQEAGSQGLLTNGDIQQNGPSFIVPMGGSSASLLRGAAPQPQGPHQMSGLGVQGTAQVGHNMATQPLLASGGQSNQQQHMVAVVSQQGSFSINVSDSMRQAQSQARASSGQGPSSIGNGSGEPGDIQATQNITVVSQSAGGEEEAEGGDLDQGAVGGEGAKYPDAVLEPIRKQMQFYFSAENLPNDKFLNSKMDPDKYIPLSIFLDFGRIKPICSNYEQLAQAVESSSILELNDTRTKVRVSQCRKTLTLRGFPSTAVEEDVRQFILDMGAPTPTHIEFVMVKDKLSTWYVSFKDESIALNSFFMLHNTKADYKGFPIGCCIKSSGTMAAAGYFPSSEESNQRRLAHQNQVAVSAVNPSTVPTVQNTMAQPQQPPTLMQQYGAMQFHHHPIMSGSPGIFYQQTPTASYMPYNCMITPSWPGPAPAMEPGIIMQNNGLQPQHIRANVAGRQHIISSTGGSPHRFNRPQRSNRQTIERSTSERPPVVSVSSASSRASPRSADGNVNTSVVQQTGGYVQRRSRDEVAQVMAPQQMIQSPHQFVTPMVTQHQQQHAATAVTATTAIVNPTALEASIQHFQPAQPQQQQHQQPMMVQAGISVPTTAPPLPTPQTSNPPPLTQQQIHHHQPPPPIPPMHHHQQPPQPTHHPQQHHHHQQQTHHPPQHTSNQHPHHQPPPPTPQTHQHQQPPHAGHHQQHHHPHPHSMMPPPHQQQHHQMPPPPPSHQQHHQQHQQPPPSNRPERRNRRNRRDENVRNQRGGERNQSNRANFSSQQPAAADNFTMEANSFPPLPGAANSITNSEVPLENRMSDVVRGKPRPTGSVSSGTPRAASSTPSPVATPAPPSVASVPTAHHGVTSAAAETHGGDDGDSAVDDDATSSSQEEVDTDGTSTDTRSLRSETPSIISPSEPSAVPVLSRSQKTSTPVAAPATVLAQRQGENKQSHNQGATRSQQSTAPPQQPALVSQASSVATSGPLDAPKLSYAQMVAQKNREAANGANTSDYTSGSSSPNPNSGTPNGPSSAQNNNTATSSGTRSSNQSSNAFREQGNYQSGQQQGSRSAPRGSSKDNLPRADGPPPSSRPPNGSRRNSKENRTSNKFDRRKPEPRPK